MHKIRPVSVEEEKVHQTHETPRAVFFDCILVLDREEFTPRPILIDPKSNLGYFVAGFVKNVEHHLFGPSPSLFQLDTEIAFVVQTLLAPMMSPNTQPAFEHACRDFSRFPMLCLGGFSAHGGGRHRGSSGGAAEAVRPTTTDKCLRILCGIIGQAESALNQPDETQHAFFS